MRPLGAIALIAASLVAVAAVAFYVVRTGTPPAGTPRPTATATATGAAQTAGPASVAPDFPLRVYFARDGMPPVAATVRVGPPGPRPEDRIGARLSAAMNARSGDVPAGAFNPLAGPPGTSGTTTSVGVRVTGDVAAVALGRTPDWVVRGSAQERIFIQQLVYTITEEPGVRRALVTKPDGSPFVVDQTVLDRPLSREDVHGYDIGNDDTEVVNSGSEGVVADLPGAGAVKWSVDEVAQAHARVTLELRSVAGAPAPQLSVRPEPVTTAREPSDGKWRLLVDLPDVRWTDPGTGVLQVDRTPLRKVTVAPGPSGRGVRVSIHLDDLRPWRVIFVPGSPNRLLIDVGGHPQAVTQSVAVHAPVAGAETGRQFGVTGVVRSFEANVQWRVRDSGGAVVARGFGTATEGSGAVWGIYDLQVSLPPTVSGNVTLEVYWGSPRDGSDVGTVAIPLRVR
ncbi:MAG TPA: Gmad2 immunoglobulin-like domain-containing protein [Candidatus Limnocylindria bacterium]|nr:Gmad2 immunoglobulin-like domain-containing protein [Candidatus Limnocylindria bacterium]